jgi:hypothetical protein
MESITTFSQIIYYIAMSIAGPLAVIAFLQVKKAERLEKEYKTYDELDNRFFEYQKLALEYYDLDMLDVPNSDPSLAFDKKRKQEMVAYAILFSLFERAYLMFVDQGDKFRARQWAGWERFLNDFIRRENVRTAWQLSKETYDTDFQTFMDRKIAAELTKELPKAAPMPLSPQAAAPEFRPHPRAESLPGAMPLAALAPVLDPRQAKSDALPAVASST